MRQRWPLATQCFRPPSRMPATWSRPHNMSTIRVGSELHRVAHSTSRESSETPSALSRPAIASGAGNSRLAASNAPSSTTQTGPRGCGPHESSAPRGPPRTTPQARPPRDPPGGRAASPPSRVVARAASDCPHFMTSFYHSLAGAVHARPAQGSRRGVNPIDVLEQCRRELPELRSADAPGELAARPGLDTQQARCSVVTTLRTAVPQGSSASVGAPMATFGIASCLLDADIAPRGDERPHECCDPTQRVSAK